MTPKEFYDLVKKFRETQKLYDKTKHYTYHHELVSLTKQIDSYIYETEATNQSKKQYQLGL